MDKARATGHSPGFADVAIAAPAGSHNLTVLTRNLRHFVPLVIPATDPFERLPRPSGLLYDAASEHRTKAVFPLAWAVRLFRRKPQPGAHDWTLRKVNEMGGADGRRRRASIARLENAFLPVRLAGD